MMIGDDRNVYMKEADESQVVKSLPLLPIAIKENITTRLLLTKNNDKADNFNDVAILIL